MQHRRRSIRTLVAGVMCVATVAACGGGGGSASSAPGTSVAATTNPATSAAAPSVAAASAAASTAAGGGGGAACDLLSVAELSGVVGGGTYSTESIPGDPSYCTYKGGDGAVKALTSLGQKDAKLGYDTWASASDSVKVAGIADGAIWVPTLATLLVIKGDKVLGITAGTGQDDEAQRIDWSKAIAALAAAKM